MLSEYAGIETENKDTNQPLVSVFLPYYNDEKYLEEAIEGILSSTYKNFELILFNHSSTDNSVNIARSFKDTRIRHIDSDVNLGAGSGANIEKCLPYMKGKYIKLLCADDVIKPEGIELLVNYLEEHPEKDFVCSDMDFVDENLDSLDTTWSKNISKVDFVSNEKETLKKFFRGYSHIAYPSTLIKMDTIKKIKIDSTLIMLFDVSLWIKLLISGHKIGFLDKSTVDYRISNNQMSSVSNMEKAGKIGYFELFQLLNLYLEISDIDMLRAICPCEYSRQLKEDETDLFPFVIAYFCASVVKNDYLRYFKDQQSVREIWGNTKIYELIQNREYFDTIQNKFNFGIKEFRDIYSYMYKSKEVCSYKRNIYFSNPKNLGCTQLIFLIIRRIYNVIYGLISFKYFRRNKKTKNKKAYTI